MSNIKVAVRVRPLNKKEKESSHILLDVHGETISIENAKLFGLPDIGDSRERIKHFTFDHCYNSACDPDDPDYASQELIFQDLGTEVLQSAFRGYNVCVFAYGQTGTGKTYTMMGCPGEIGLIPRICEGLFSHVDNCAGGKVTCRVDVSYYEIYNERVRDLLQAELHRPNEKYTLKVREHPKQGPYVQDSFTATPEKLNYIRPELFASPNDDTVMVNDSVATDLYRKVRIFCIILTMEKDLYTKVQTVNNTWAKRCNKHFFIMNTLINKPDIINSQYPDEREYLINKVQSAFEFLHDKYMDEFDWILKADDDTYVITENLRYLLSHYYASKSGYLGYKFDKFVASGYMSGGAGYVISRQGIKQLVENGIRAKKFPLVQTEENPELSEDLLIGECLQNSHVPILNSRDIYGRDTFHPYPVEQHLLGVLPSYLYTWCKVPPVEGLNCCSQFTISFHYIKPESMILVDHLLYRTSVFGRTLPINNKRVFQAGESTPKWREQRYST